MPWNAPLLVCGGNIIHGRHLFRTLQIAEASGTAGRVSLGDAVASYEKELIQDALKSTRGNRIKAARLLSTTERILNYKVKKYAIDCSRFRKQPEDRPRITQISRTNAAAANPKGMWGRPGTCSQPEHRGNADR